MAMLKTMSRKVGGCKQIKAYLERNDRNVTFQASTIFLTQDNWDQVMDITRRSFGKDTGRKYYHFIISPDPEDNLTANDVDRLAGEWANARYPGYQWIIETHVDNGIPHAHIVINSVNPNNGMKIHLDNDDVQLDAAKLQALCKEYGYRAFDSYDLAQADDGEWYARSPKPKDRKPFALQEPRPARRASTNGQRKARYSKVKLWTDRMHDDIEEQLQGCRTWESFERKMSAIGYRLNVNRRGVLTFYPPEGSDAHPIKGYKLDDSYTVEGIEERLAVRLEGHRTHVKMLDPSLIPSVKLPPQTFGQIVENVYTRKKNTSRDPSAVAAAADALNIIRTRKYTGLAQMRADAKRLSDGVAAIEQQAESLTLEAKQTDEAIRQIEIYEANRTQLTRRPTDPASQDAWRKQNAPLLDEMHSIEKWMAERGIEIGDTTYTDLTAKRSDIETSLRSTMDDATRIKRQALRMQAAVDVLMGEPVALGATDLNERNRREGRTKKARTATAITQSQSEKLRDAYAAYQKNYLDAVQSGALTPERIKQIEEDYEKAKWKIISRENAEIREIEQSYYGMPGQTMPAIPDKPIAVPVRTGEEFSRGDRENVTFLNKPATERQLKYIQDLIDSERLERSEVDELGDNPTIGDVNALLNAHPEVKKVRLEDEEKRAEEREQMNREQQQTSTATATKDEPEPFTPTHFTRRH